MLIHNAHSDAHTHSLCHSLAGDPSSKWLPRWIQVQYTHLHTASIDVDMIVAIAILARPSATNCDTGTQNEKRRKQKTNGNTVSCDLKVFLTHSMAKKNQHNLLNLCFLFTFHTMRSVHFKTVLLISVLFFSCYLTSLDFVYREWKKNRLDRSNLRFTLKYEHKIRVYC